MTYTVAMQRPGDTTAAGGFTPRLFYTAIRFASAFVKMGGHVETLPSTLTIRCLSQGRKTRCSGLSLTTNLCASVAIVGRRGASRQR